MSNTPALRLLPQGIWDMEVASMAETAADWLLTGFVAPANEGRLFASAKRRTNGSWHTIPMV
jgi:hypothetical protein